jgi:hypothetical protein
MSFPPTAQDRVGLLLPGAVAFPDLLHDATDARLAPNCDKQQRVETGKMRVDRVN